MTDNIREQNNNAEKLEKESQQVSNEINTIVNQEIGKNKEKEAITIDADSIHVMPKRFLPQSPKKKLSNKQKFVLAIIGFVLFLIMVVGVMLWFADRSIKQLPSEQNNSNNQQNSNQQAQQLTHDEQIIKDLEEINSALRRYYTEFKVYPSSLSVLSDYFDNGVPRGPDGLNYDYELTELGNNFIILIDFDGSDQKNRVGKYQYTKNGLTYYNPDQPQNNNQVITPPPPPPSNNATSTPITPPPPPPTVANLDVDADQLTADEENIYNTDPNDEDSDNDGFKDGVEITNLYNPSSTSGQLLDSGLVSIYNSAGYSYSVFYPTSWVVEAIDEEDKQIVFLSDTETGEFISVQIFTNDFALTMSDWRDRVGVDSQWVGYTLGKKQKLTAYKTTDGNHVLFVKDGSGSSAYLISHNIEQGEQKHFNITFEMMLSSFEITND